MTATTLNDTRPARDADLPQQPPAAVSVPARPFRHETTGDETKRWKRLRWGVRVALVVGVAASVAANMLHALPNPISQAIAAWPPLALLLTVELISRVPVYRRALAAVRLLATTVIAGIAAWVSYWHMVGVAAHYGETGASPYLLPMSVDGLVVVASVCLVELSGRIHRSDPGPPSAGRTDGNPPAAPERQPVAEPPQGRRQAASTPGKDTQNALRHIPHRRAAGEAVQPPPTTAPGAESSSEAKASTAVGGAVMDATVTASTAAGNRNAARTIAEPTRLGASGHHADPATSEEAVPTGTAAAVAYWRRRDPGMHPDDIAARIGKSSRQVRRYLPPLTRNGGHAPQRR